MFLSDKKPLAPPPKEISFANDYRAAVLIAGFAAPRVQCVEPGKCKQTHTKENVNKHTPRKM